jgi:hypothetical protein
VNEGYLPGALAGAAGSPDPMLVHSAVGALLPELGAPVDQLGVRVLWGGPIGNSTEPGAVAVVLTVRVPSGAVLLAGWYGADLAAAPGRERARRDRPAAGPAADPGCDGPAAEVRNDQGPVPPRGGTGPWSSYGC